MYLAKIIGSSIFQVLSLAFLLLYLLGGLNTYFSDRTNYCVMTYMFQYPQFVRITVPENGIYPQYGLYAYGEGRLTEKTRKMWFDGIPVLFLPGNSGSHMQGRSLASVALRKALSDSHDYHFDFFMVSYNEDLSGVYGGVLQSETEFAAACINKILSLYKSNKYTKTVPSSVILIGHSMGGLIAKRLLAYPNTIDVANIAITLAAPLQAPVINTDLAMDDFYKLISLEWNVYINGNEEVRNKKVLLSFGNGPRDVLMPSGLTSSDDSDINALTTAIPGVWVSPDHVSIVWCKQLVLTLNRFLFAIVNPETEQVAGDKQLILAKARQYFEANRSMTLDSKIARNDVNMLPDAFWYEDNRRIYQISRPEINKTTYLMIRLISFPQNRFVAIESVNVDDTDWIFGCNAQFTYGTHRYCKQATPLSELSRWTGAATNFGRRKLATVHLHDIIDKYPSWTHVVVRVSPTRKPITLNVDINDHASRSITVDLPSGFSLSKKIIKEETEANSLYYELILPGFDLVYQAYYLYVDPTPSCKAANYQVSAELHVPWAKNYEYYHYFTHLKLSPMKLRLFKSNPNVTAGLEGTEHVKITLLLDPQCTYTISISTSWYHRLAQLARNYTPVLFPYMAAIILLAARSNIQHLHEKGSCISMHGALMSEGVKPYYALVFSRLGVVFLMSIPALSFLFESPSWNNPEVRYFSRSLLVLPAYMTALGVVNVSAAAVLAVMICSSQLAHKLLFRIVWRGGPSVAERVASGLQKVPMLFSSVLILSVPLSCGAASLAAGAAFYAFMISKMFEEYLEDYVYKIMAKVASRLCRIFLTKKKTPTEESQSTSLLPKTENSDESSACLGDAENFEDKNKSTAEILGEEAGNTKSLKLPKESEKGASKSVEDSTRNEIKSMADKPASSTETEAILVLKDNKKNKIDKSKVSEKDNKTTRRKSNHEMDDMLSGLNFHMMMFFLWLVVTLVNVPALLTWARNFRYNMVLKPDTSYHTGFVMSICSVIVWQIEGPRRNLKYLEQLSALLFTMAVFILALGPLSLTIVNYGVTTMFALITVQQFFGSTDNVEEENSEECVPKEGTEDKEGTESEVGTEGTEGKVGAEGKEGTEGKVGTKGKVGTSNESAEKEQCDVKFSSGKSKQEKTNEQSQSDSTSNTQPPSDCDVCSESRIYNIVKNLREKFTFNEDL